MSAIRKIPITAFGQEVSGIEIAIGSSIEFDFACQDANTRGPLDLTNGAVVMSLCALDSRGNPLQPALFARQAVIVNPPGVDGLANASWVPADTVPGGNPLQPGSYGVDVWFTDGAGNRLQTLAFGIIELTPAATLPATTVTPLAPVPPIATSAAAPDSGNAIRYIYVRTTGSDTTGDGTLALPYRTVKHALTRLINVSWKLYQVIDCTGIGTEQNTETLIIPPVLSSSHVMAEPGQTFEPFGFIAPLTIRALPTVAFAAGASSYSVAGVQLANGGGPSPCNFAVITMNVDPGWANDQWKRHVLYVSSAQNLPFPFSTGVIIGNTHNTLTVCIDQTVDIFNLGFSILSLSAELHLSTTNGEAVLQALSVGAGLSLQGLHITQPTGNPVGSNGALGVGGLEDLRLELCDITGVDLGGAFSTNPIAQSCVFRLADPNQGTFTSSVGMEDSSINFVGCFFDGLMISLSTSGFFGTTYLKCNFDGCAGVPSSAAQFTYTACRNVNAQSGGTIQYAGGPTSAANNVEVSNSIADDAIHASGPGKLFVNNVLGSGNAGAGLFVPDGTQVQVDSLTTVTGANGDLLVGILPKRTWADFRTNAPVNHQLDLSTLARVWSS